MRRTPAQERTEPGRAATSQCLETALEPRRHAGIGAVGIAQGARARRLQGNELAPPSAALGRRIADPRAEEPLLLEAVQRRVDGADRQPPAGARLDLTPDRGAIRIVLETDDG